MFGTKTKASNGFPSTAQLLPFLAKMGEFLKKGFEHCAHLSVVGSSISPESLQTFLLLQMSSWNPKVKGKEVLDAQTKQALARFLAGVALNLYYDGEK